MNCNKPKCDICTGDIGSEPVLVDAYEPIQTQMCKSCASLMAEEIKKVTAAIKKHLD